MEAHIASMTQSKLVRIPILFVQTRANAWPRALQHCPLNLEPTLSLSSLGKPEIPSTANPWMQRICAGGSMR